MTFKQVITQKQFSFGWYVTHHPDQIMCVTSTLSHLLLPHRSAAVGWSVSSAGGTQFLFLFVQVAV